MAKAELGPLHGLYAITPEDHDTERLVQRVTAALEGGAAAVQYRAKGMPEALAHVQATQLKRLCASFGVLFIINDSVLLAMETDADGVHLGRDDCAVADARKQLPDALIGVSCYNDFSLAEDAIGLGADYVAFGSFFPSLVKPNAARAETTLLGRARQSGFNAVAIGGITVENARTLINAGADAIAVISGLFDSNDLGEICANARAFNQLFNHA